MFQQTGFGSLLKEVSALLEDDRIIAVIGLKALLWSRGGDAQKHRGMQDIVQDDQIISRTSW